MTEMATLINGLLPGREVRTGADCLPLLTERKTAVLTTLQGQMVTHMGYVTRVVLFVLPAVALFSWCIIRPNVGRRFARVFAVAAIGIGIGFLTWGICAAALGEAIRSPLGLTSLIAAPSEAIGWGAGSLAAGITALVFSFVGGARNP